MALWDDVKKNLVEWYTVTSEKTSEAARIGSRRWDKFGISRDIERQFSELGNLVYSGLKEDREEILASEEVQGLVRRIETLELELKAKDQEIEDIKSEYKRESARAQKRHSGGQDVPPGAPFAEFGDDAEDGTDEDEAVTETVLKDPVLGRGGEDSAILVEPDPALEDYGDDPLAEPSDPDDRS